MKHVGMSVCVAVLGLAAAGPLRAQQLCGTPGKDGAFVGGGTVNTYYPPGIAPVLLPGDTTLPVDLPSGAVPPGGIVSNGDLLLIIQMQDGRINSSNTDSYGSGAAGPGSGMTAIGSAGLYEYVVVTGVTGNPATSLTISGGGPGGGLINSYFHEDFQGAAHLFDENDDGDTTDLEDSHAAHGRRRYQIVRVPQYTTATLTAQLTCTPWDSATAVGGVLAIDVRDDLTFSGVIDHVSVSGRGFRGAGSTRARGNLGLFAGQYSSTDFRQPSGQPASPDGAHGNKGEGAAGTPRFVWNDMTDTLVDLTTDGYPDGSRARGAPGNAGGGGNTGNPSSGTEEAGGGGGGNGGAGGQGGNTNATNLPLGGRGGGAFPWAFNRLAMGGGGGSGQRNDAGQQDSHAASGGGIVFIRTNTVSLAGGATAGRILADGGSAEPAGNDASGGGGAGGSVLIFAKAAGELVDVLVFARGGTGGDAGTGSNLVGPGGGGGGGVILASDTLGGADTTAGPSGVTGSGGGVSYGSSSGTGAFDVPGVGANPFVTADDIPGAGGGADCSIDDPPTAVDDAASTSTNNAVIVTVLANDSDPEGTALMVTLVTQGANGGVVINGDNTVTYTPNAAFVGVDTFTYTISDGTSTDTATVTVTVGNLAPVITAPAGASTPEDTGLVFNTISVDDPDDSNATIRVTLTVTSGTLTLSGTTGLTFVGGANGSAAVAFEGSEANVNAALAGMTFQPVADSLAAVTLSILLEDLAPTIPLSDSETVAITVTAVNDPPVAQDDAYAAFSGVTRTISGAVGVLSNDADPEGDTLTAVLDVGPVNGVLTLNPDGSFAYTANSGFVGTDTFTYHANDGTDDSNIATVTITVTPNPVIPRLRAGYCGLTGMEALLLIGLLRLRRRAKGKE